ALHDGPRHANLPVVVVEQRAVGVDRRGADDGVVGTELPDEVHGRLADHAAVAVPHHAAGEDDLVLGVAAQDVRDVDVVGDHHEATARPQRHRDLLGGRPDV